MDTRRLSAFCTIYDLRSVSRAAEKLHITQPAVTLQIRRLEAEVGCRLLQRVGRGIAPTPAGDVFYQSARRMLDALRAGEEQLRALQKRVDDQVSLGCPTGVLYYLPPLLSKLRGVSPGLVVTLRTGVCGRICDAVLDGSIEVGLVWQADDGGDLQVERLQGTEFVAIAHPRHELAGRRSVAAAELARQPLLLPVRESGTRQFLEDRLAAGDSALTAAMEFDDVDALKQATKENLGIGFVAKKAVEEEIGRGTLVVVDVEGGPLERDILIVVDPRRKLSGGAELLVRIARDLPQ